MTTETRSQNFYLIIFASLYAGIAIVFPPLWFLAPFGLSLFFYILFTKTQSHKEACLYGFIFGIATAGAGTLSFLDTFPVHFIPIEDTFVQYAIIIVPWLFTTITLALPTTFYGAFIYYVRNTPLLPALAIVGFVLQEEARGWVFSLLSLGHQSLIGSHFSVTALGYTLAEQPYLLQLAENGGIGNLNMFLATLACVLFYGAIYKTSQKQNIASVLATLVFLALLLLAPLRMDTSQKEQGETIRVALISARTPLDVTIDPGREYLNTLTTIAKSGEYPDIIVFPENNGLSYMYPVPEERQDFVRTLFPEKEVLIISSHYAHKPDSVEIVSTSKISYESSKKGTIATYDKLFLMPKGEYSPHILSLIFPLFRNESVTNQVTALETELEKGDSLITVPYQGTILGTLLCSEILSAHLYRDLVEKHDAEILINVAGTSWFHGSRKLFSKTLQLAKVHAVQNRTYFLLAAHGSPAFAINSQGELIARSEWNKNEVIYVDIPVSQKLVQ